jgi:hypothetical protein
MKPCADTGEPTAKTIAARAIKNVRSLRIAILVEFGNSENFEIGRCRLMSVSSGLLIREQSPVQSQHPDIICARLSASIVIDDFERNALILP